MTSFRERQTFAPWVIALVVGALFIPVVLTVFLEPNHGGPALLVAFGVCFVIFLLITGTLGVMETEVTDTGIAVTFGFFRLIKYRYRYEDIEQAVARSYRPIEEYGGWGIKGWDDRKQALNMKGNRGVELTLRSTRPHTRQIMIGSQRPEELEQAIRAHLLVAQDLS